MGVTESARRFDKAWVIWSTQGKPAIVHKAQFFFISNYLQSMMLYNPNCRISARNAMQNAYFNKVEPVLQVALPQETP